MKKWLITICTIVLLVGIYFILKIDNLYLGDSYYYLPKYEALDIGYPYGAIIYKSKQKNVFNDVKITNDVINVNSNRDFIIAIQQQNNSNIIQILNYFIIVKKTDKVYGPYDKTEYLIKRKKLGLPEELQF